MSTLPETFPLDHSDTALDVLGDRLYMAVGSCDGRLAKAVALVRSGAVAVVKPHYAIVQSQADASTQYHVNPRCVCEDAIHRAPEGRCKHYLGAQLAHKLVKPAISTPKALPLPEAPVSINCHVMLAGRQAQLTVRGIDASVLVAELETLLERFPVTPPAPGFTPEKGKTSTQAAWCTMHQTAMNENTKEGRRWYSHRRDDGSWCKGR